MTWFGAAGFLTGITGTIMVFIILMNKPSDLQKKWALFNIFVAIWGFGSFSTTLATNSEDAFLAWRVAHLGVIFIPVTFYHFVHIFTQIKGKFFLRAMYVFSITFAIFNFFTNLFITHMEYLFGSIYYARSNNLVYPMYFFVWLMLVLYGHLILIQRYNSISSQLEKTKIQYLFISVVVGFVGGLMNFFPILGLKIYPYGNASIPIYLLVVTYAIRRFRLMDISLAITRTSIFIAVYSLVLGIPFAVAFGLQDQLKVMFDQNWWIFPLISSTVLATIGPYIYIFLQKKAEDRLLQEQRQYQATLRQASLGMGQIKDLKRLLSLIVHVVTRAVKIENCKIYLRHEDSKRFILKAVKGEKTNLDENNFLEFDSSLVKYFNQMKEPLVHEEIKQRHSDFGGEGLKEIENNLDNMDAALVVPSFIEQKLIAVISLGKKRSGKLYTHDDLAVFAILANQSALAIENAQFYEDMKRTHVQLMKAEKMATVGTMADGLSHQINNRLHAMGFIAGDLIDTIKHGKVNGQSEETKELLEDIESGLERIQQNVKHGGEIVGGLLRYTRKGEQGFAAVKLKDLIKSALEMAQFKIKVSMLDIEKHFDDSLPEIKGNFTQLQEVFFNLIDNAYDAMIQRKEDLKEEGFRPHLDIFARVVGPKIEIILQDNGMGVKDADMHKLFTPFFTTKATSKKGTGLGLYVIRQIIEDNHGGKVNFSSKYKIGSETQILLPIAVEKKG